MTELLAALLGVFLGSLATRQIEASRSRLERTLNLLQEFDTDAMQEHRYATWLRRETLFRERNFDAEMARAGADEFGPDHVLFHVMSFMNFFRKISVYGRRKKLHRRECRRMFGPLFALYWEEIFTRAMAGHRPGDAHHLLWSDLEDLAWLRRGFEAPFRK